MRFVIEKCIYNLLNHKKFNSQEYIYIYFYFISCKNYLIILIKTYLMSDKIVDSFCVCGWNFPKHKLIVCGQSEGMTRPNTAMSVEVHGRVEC